MDRDVESITARLASLERQVYISRVIAVAAVLLAVSYALVPGSEALQAPGQLRVRQLIVEDADGRSRMVLGYMDAAGNTRRFGMRINDPAGVERFGLSYLDTGRIAMGFDAPPGTGDERNRERINIGADENGGSYIRFLDRRTGEAARMYLDEQNRVWLRFSEFSQNAPPRFRQYGLAGEEVIQPK